MTNPEKIEAKGVSLPLRDPGKNDSALRAAIINLGGLSDEQKAHLERSDMFNGIGRLLSKANLLEETFGMSDEARETRGTPLFRDCGEGFAVYNLSHVASNRNLVIFQNPEDDNVIVFLPVDLNTYFRRSFKKAMDTFGRGKLNKGLTDESFRVYTWGRKKSKVREDFREIKNRVRELSSKRVNLE